MVVCSLDDRSNFQMKERRHIENDKVFFKDPDAGKDWKQEEKRMTEDEMVGWHHWLNGYEFE